MALVDGGKQRAISLDYPVYYSPGACLDILNGFMADAGDPALGGGGSAPGGSGGASAPSLGQPGQCGAAPRGPRVGNAGTPNGDLGPVGRRGEGREELPFLPRRAADLVAGFARFYSRNFGRRCKVYGKAGLKRWDRPRRGAVGPEQLGDGGVGRWERNRSHLYGIWPLPPPSCRDLSVHALLLVNY